jgi:hypothetical protein
MCEWGIDTLIYRDSEDMKRSEDVNIARDISTHTHKHTERERERDRQTERCRESKTDT